MCKQYNTKLMGGGYSRYANVTAKTNKTRNPAQTAWFYGVQIKKSTFSHARTY